MSHVLSPVEGPAAWRGDVLGQTDSWIHHFTEEELDELETVGKRFLRDDPDLRFVSREDYPLPVCSETIAAWGNELDYGRGFLLARGLRVQEYSHALSASIYFLLGLYLGTPMRQNQLGDLVDHIRATSNKTQDDPTSLSSRIRSRLGYHSDSSDVVALMCLHPSMEGGASSLVSGMTIYNEVLRERPDLAPLMFEKWYWDWYKQDHDAPAPVYDSPMCAYEDGVFSFYGGNRILYTAQDYPEVPRLTPEQIELLELLEDIAARPGIALHMDFRQGDIQWLLNYSALHARTDFVDFPEPDRRRHLMRLWLQRKSGRPVPEGFGRHVVRARHHVEPDDEVTGKFSIHSASIQRHDWGL
ncbi:TauD/TfdA family dioxygenase [Rhodococcus rhodochrous]|uniref:TauD/TfdA family dioxygenase n=1 Tax=Rhodococcus rhodochrous TaxID=1829 RepID=UPI0024B9383D|nr:TauD/TfdA family dioxygenase [Rhodococcus rhodochrous]MDJ0397850.1 TauD/TfdA family dioxygenase [Rhodococcus rhodochrous]